MKLQSLVPCFYAFLTQSLTNGNILNIQVKPVKTISNGILYQPEIVIGYLLPEGAETGSNEVHKISIGNGKGQIIWKHCHKLTGVLCCGKIKIELKENSFILFLNTNKRVYFKETVTRQANSGLDMVFQCFGVKLEILEPFLQLRSDTDDVQRTEDFLSSIDSSGYVKTEYLHGIMRETTPTTPPGDQKENFYENVDINGEIQYNQDIHASLDSMGYIRLDEVSPDRESSIKKLYEPIWPSLQRELRLMQSFEITESDYSDVQIETTPAKISPSVPINNS